MIENNIPEDQAKTIEVLLNKKAPKRHSSEKRKLVFITTGVLLAIATPVTIAAVLVTKAHTEKDTISNELKNQQELLNKIAPDMNALTRQKIALNDKHGVLDKVLNGIEAMKNNVSLNLTPEALKELEDIKVLVNDLIKKVEDEQLSVTNAIRTLIAQQKHSQVIETIYII